MNSALWAAKTGLDAQQTRMAVISNNLANVNTTGFKKDRAVFEDLLYQNVAAGGRRDLAGHGLAHRPEARHRRARRGHREDLHAGRARADRQCAGRGDQWPRLLPGADAGRQPRLHPRRLVQDEPGGRAGDLQRLPHPAGHLAFRRVRRASPSAPTARSARSSPGQAAPTQVGTLQLTDFVNPAGLQPRGENLLLESAASGPAQTGNPGLNGLGTLQQGSLEGSNVNVVEELVNMIETQRAYEMNSKAISTTDQMLQYVSNNL